MFNEGILIEIKFDVPECRGSTRLIEMRASVSVRGINMCRSAEELSKMQSESILWVDQYFLEECY